jgi:hypothetical protein
VETTRDADAILSIFDDNCFKFYLVKYCEILGKEALISMIENDTSALKISYYQKIRIIDYIISYEQELNVQHSSWKHCLLFLFLNGVINNKELSLMLEMPNDGPRYKLEKRNKKLAEKAVDTDN